MADDLTGGSGDSTSSDSFDIGSILGGTSGSPETTPTGGQPNANDQGDPAAQQSGQYKFGGRSYATQKAAEEAHNKLYGKFSEQQSLLNQMKEALKNPSLMQKFRGDPSLETILSKLGVEEAEAAAEQAEAEADAKSGGIPQGMEQYIHEWNTERATHQLEREEWAFERQLGRPIDPKERRSVMDLIAKHDSLTYAEAWKLAFHDKLLKDAATKRQAQQGQAGGRPIPKALNVPGIKIDTKKPIEAQSNEEFRESLREELRAHSRR